MQASPGQLAKDHHHISNIEVVARKFGHSVRVNKGFGTRNTNFQVQESSDGAPQNFEHPVLLKEVLGTQKTNIEGEESHDHAAHKFELLKEDLGTISEDQESFHDAEEDETGDGEDFSFTFDGATTSPIAAEDAFLDGKIKPMFPLFNQDLLLDERYFEESLTANPNVKKVLIEMNKHSLDRDDISGPYCEWTAEKDRCKKSNSTGFSKLWRLKDLVTRSNSDGKDAFVFFNSDQNGTSFRKREDKTASDQNGTSVTRREDEKSTKNSGEVKDIEKVKKGGKKKTTTTLSSHEVYLKNKAKENDGRKKSYMPYKPEVFGFFTNVNGGISKNVHPY